MNIPSIHIPMPILLGIVGVLLTVGLGWAIYFLVYRRGYKVGYAVGRQEGLEAAKLKGAYCDVCQKVAEKFVMLKMHVVCEACEMAITSNKEMKCRFCKNPVDQCSCT